jgi:hypothetical protein
MKLLFSIYFILFTVTISYTQVTPYTGGNGSGYQSGILTIGNCALYFGGIADGAATNLSTLTVCPEFFGGIGDGYATDSTGCIAILAIKLLTFYGEKEPLRNILHWKTEDGFNVKEFEVQKSASGVNFTKAGTVAGSVNSNFNYLFIDTKPFPDLSFYRLRITERDGEVSYSKIIVLKTSSQSSITVYPNPNKGLATIYYYSNQLLITRLLIYHADGRLVHASDLKIAAGANFIPLDLQQLANGMYMLRIGESSKTIKILVQKD